MTRISLFLYNLLFAPILAVLLPGYLLRVKRRGGYGHKAPQRFGILSRETAERIGTGRIWLHAVSVGEAGIALKFATMFRRRNPEARFLVSSTTSTGLSILEKSASEWLEPMANPIDLPIITSRLVKRLRPTAVVMVEADLWPNRIAACRRMRIPVLLINARLSTRSERRFRWARLLGAPFFNQLDLITLTGKEDLPRWLSLGVRGEILHWTGNVKYDEAQTPVSGTSESPRLPTALGWGTSDPILLAASTHEGEEAEVADAFLSLRREHPSLRLVVVPRHAERRTSLKEALRKRGLTYSLRSEGILHPADVLILDTTGELSGWYGLSTIVFVGKSLPSSVNRGGQNMIEPLQLGKPVLTGPHTGNFEPLATQLCEAGALLRVTDAAGIASTVHSLLRNPEMRRAMTGAANQVLEAHQGAAARNCEAVEKVLQDF